MDEPTAEDPVVLQMAALIAAVRTARFDGKDFKGMSTPRTICAIQDSLWLAHKIREIAARNQSQT